jgi:membrane fusion protein (multidrug efflux system)
VPDEPVGGRRAAITSRLPSGRKALMVVLVALILAAWAAHWVYFRWAHVHVDDARIDGEVVTVSSRVSGWITELPVIEGDSVTAGQLLARIDDRDSKLRLESLTARLKTVEGQMSALKAQVGQVDQETLGRVESESNRLAATEAEVKSLEFQVKQAHADYQRAQDLHTQRWLSQQAMERSRTTFQQVQENHRKAMSEVAAARGILSAAGGSRKQIQVLQQQYTVLIQQANEIRAEMRRQEIDVQDRMLLSPADGRVVMTFVRKGEHVTAGQRMMMFHDPSQIWVEANVRETEIRLLQPGMKADIRVDAYPGRVFEAEVFRIGQAATSKFALLPDPNPSGNFTKITQRLPVRLLLKEKDALLRPGMMVEVDVAVR